MDCTENKLAVLSIIFGVLWFVVLGLAVGGILGATVATNIVLLLFPILGLAFGALSKHKDEKNPKLWIVGIAISLIAIILLVIAITTLSASPAWMS